jgi:hypothetical protein
MAMPVIPSASRPINPTVKKVLITRQTEASRRWLLRASGPKEFQQASLKICKLQKSRIAAELKSLAFEERLSHKDCSLFPYVFARRTTQVLAENRMKHRTLASPGYSRFLEPFSLPVHPSVLTSRHFEVKCEKCEVLWLQRGY